MKSFKFNLIIIGFSFLSGISFSKDIPLTIETENQSYEGTLNSNSGVFLIDNINFKNIQIFPEQKIQGSWSCDQVSTFLKKQKAISIPESIYNSGLTLIHFKIFDLITNYDQFMNELNKEADKLGVSDVEIGTSFTLNEVKLDPILEENSIFNKGLELKEAKEFLTKSINYGLNYEKKNSGSSIWLESLSLPSSFVYCDMVNRNFRFVLKMSFTTTNKKTTKDSFFSFTQVKSIGQEMNEYVKSEIKNNQISNDQVILRARKLENILNKSSKNIFIVDDYLFLRFWHGMFEEYDGPFILTDQRARDIVRLSTKTTSVVKTHDVSLILN